MKCDELKMFDCQGCLYHDEHFFYSKSEVDAAIAELKEFSENACFERDDNQNVIDELQVENRKLKHSLWLARALALSRFDVDKYLRKYTHCNSRFWNNGFNTFNEACKQMQKAINIAEAKCRAKAKELE